MLIWKCFISQRWQRTIWIDNMRYCRRPIAIHKLTQEYCLKVTIFVPCLAYILSPTSLAPPSTNYSRYLYMFCDTKTRSMGYSRLQVRVLERGKNKCIWNEETGEGYLKWCKQTIILYDKKETGNIMKDCWMQAYMG